MKRVGVLGLVVIGWVMGFIPSAWAMCEVMSQTASFGLGTVLASPPCGVSGGSWVELRTLLAGEDQTNQLFRTSGGAVRSTVMGTGMVVGGDGVPKVAVVLPVNTKTIYGAVNGTGAVTQTQKIYGGVTSGLTEITGDLLCTLTLSGTTHAHAACAAITVNYLFYMVVTSATTGTGATGTVTAMY